MAYLNERVSYLIGMADGLNIDDATPENKLIKAMLDVMQEMADEIEVMTGAFDDIAEDLADLMDYCYNEDFEYDDCIEVECDSCGEVVEITDEMIDENGTVLCPNCGKPIDIDNLCDFDYDDYDDEE